MHHQCDHCQRQFTSTEELKRHRAELHADMPRDPAQARTEDVLRTGTNMTGHSGTRPPAGTEGPARP